jgi:quercetin dioxygenase-like cupin family protein
MLNQPFDFRGTLMTIRATTAETGAYAVIEMQHPPSVGPALHVHPRGAEVFIIAAGTYTFVRSGEVVVAQPGDTVVIPANTPHRYTSGPAGGRAIVITPPTLESYFWEIAHRLQDAPVPLDTEFTVAAEYGQDFLERAGHWGAIASPSRPEQSGT